MPCEGLLAMREMELLDFSNNRLTNQYMYNPRCVYNGTMPNLQTLYYTNNELTSLKVISSSVRYFVRLKVLDVSFNHLGSAPLSTGCIWNHNITRFIAHHNEFASESLLCLPATVEYLDLSYCSLDKVDTAFFDKAVNLKEVLLSGNKIKYIPPNWKSPTLRSLELDGNSFGVITVNSFQDMPLMKSLKAGNNPYQCTCELHAFFEDTLSKAMVNLTDWPWNYHCYHPQALLNTYISKFVPGRLACDVRLVVLIAVATTAAFLMALMVVCYVFELPWYTKATYQILRAKYRAYQTPPGEEAMLRYHAFISYSHWDADWVRDQLLPALEDRGNPYRLCIHERDFTPGKWIIDNIIKNIENSHKMIFVLSRHFVNSEWCNYELYFAQQRAMGKTFHDVILVLKEPIDPGSLPNKYCKLKKMLSTRTYLEWPQQQNQRAFFWAQLRSVLGRPAVVRSRSGSQRSRGGSEEREPLVDRPGLSVEVIEERE
uniref:TIR domain-containing protein n=1 Tax=Knipowitschia caucasica TaxID=637954 RepID=A0AAV2MF83_KNICA